MKPYEKWLLPIADFHEERETSFAASLYTEYCLFSSCLIVHVNWRHSALFKIGGPR